MFQGARRTGALGWVSVGSACTNVLLNLLLVPPYGALGAAIATLAAYSAGCVALHLLGGAAVRFQFFPRYLLKCFAAATVMLVTVMGLLASPLGSDLVRFVMALALGPLIYFVVLLKLKALSAEEWQGLRAMIRRRGAH
jgi:O-antigen/teichoic acid export membrane protein